jgi:hypothetical protein
MKQPEIPERFCWTKFGSEAGEGIDKILARKDRERVTNGGVFLWGIGNSVAPGIRALVRHEDEPAAIFSPMRAKAKTIDSAPARVVVWRGARGVDGREWDIPRGSTVTSRGDSSGGMRKRSHYALVCRSDAPLRHSSARSAQLRFGSICNLLSGSPLGYSQVTSVVGYRECNSDAGPLYAIGFRARLVYPYFVELFDPIVTDTSSLVSLNFNGTEPAVTGPRQLALE